MIRIFIDSSVLFSAAYSATRHSRDILVRAAREEVILVICKLVLVETRRNLEGVAPQAVVFLDRLVEAVPFEYVRPSKYEVTEAAKRVALKDAPIVAAARKAGV